MRQYPHSQLPSKDWCHTASDGPLSEPHQVAEKVALCRAWLHNALTHPHYDLTPARRAQAISLGVLDLVRRCFLQVLGQGLPPQTKEDAQ